VDYSFFHAPIPVRSFGRPEMLICLLLTAAVEAVLFTRLQLCRSI
jgi:hypothetical protein